VTGELAVLGDTVSIDSIATGVVVGIVHTGQYSGEHKREHWDHYGSGVLVEGPATGLIFYREPDLFARLSKIT
jgi:hypothetical protein